MDVCEEYYTWTEEEKPRVQQPYQRTGGGVTASVGVTQTEGLMQARSNREERETGRGRPNQRTRSIGDGCGWL